MIVNLALAQGVVAFCPVNPKAYRLPRDIWPQRYDVTLYTSPHREEFSGRVSIDFQVKRPSDVLVLHAKAFALDNAQFQMGQQTWPGQITLDPEREIARIKLDTTLPVGFANLTLQFRGKTAKSMHGLYLGKDGDEIAICSQCEATDARALFPCFDEPEFKAELKWTVCTEPEFQVLTNGVLLDTQMEGPLKRWSFQATPPISSYLAAVVVGDFQSGPVHVLGPARIHTSNVHTGAAVRGIAESREELPLRVWALAAKTAQTQFANDFTRRLVPWYEAYFGLVYPYGKYDQVAVPGFDAGAMENVGLVLFRQNYLLMNPETASWQQEKIIALVIAHELAHMWFGNLVTMKWWDDLWLNEAFAEWFAHKAVAAIEPSYLVWNDFIDDRERALFDDALPTTHPIWTEVKTPDEAVEMFDSITYQKGCAVMRMIENFLGDSAFKTGIQNYMREFRQSNAQGDDLWRHLEQAAKQPVKQLMHSWIEQPGFPVVSISQSHERDAGTLQLTQTRFYSNPQIKQTDNSQSWSIPMVFRYGDDAGTHEHRCIFSQNQQDIKIPLKGQLHWCFGNAEGIGFYRLQFDETLRAGLLREGKNVLSPVEQRCLISDQWALVRANRSNIAEFLPVLDRFAGAEDHDIVRTALGYLGSLDAILKDAEATDARAALRTWIHRLYQPHFVQLGFAPKPDESQNHRQLRPLAIRALAVLSRDTTIIQQAKQQAADERRDPASIDANLAGTVVSIAARFGDAEDYQTWWQTWQTRQRHGASPQLVQRYLHTITNFRDAKLLTQTLASVQKNQIPQQELGGTLQRLLAERQTQEATWHFLKQNWEDLKELVGSMGRSRLVEATGSLKPHLRQDIVDFFQQHPPVGAERALDKALQMMDQAEELRQRVTKPLIAWLGSVTH